MLKEHSWPSDRLLYYLTMHLLAMVALSSLMPPKKGTVDPPFKKGTGLGGGGVIFQKRRMSLPSIMLKKLHFSDTPHFLKLGKLGHLDRLRVIRAYANIRIF